MEEIINNEVMENNENEATYEPVQSSPAENVNPQNNFDAGKAFSDGFKGAAINAAGQVVGGIVVTAIATALTIAGKAAWEGIKKVHKSRKEKRAQKRAEKENSVTEDDLVDIVED